MKKKISLFLFFAYWAVVVGYGTQALAMPHNFEVTYDGVGYTPASPAADPLNNLLGAGHSFQYTIEANGNDYWEVVNPVGWNPWLFLRTDIQPGNFVTFDFKAELYLGATPVLNVPFGGPPAFPIVGGSTRVLGEFHPLKIGLGTMFDRIVLSANIFSASNPFSITDYEPYELDPTLGHAAYRNGAPAPNPGPAPGPAPVPEPATFLLFGLGLTALAGVRKLKKSD